ncbi:hypothetical protein KBY58_09800 [Cyanobium sp. HWJ4-Hawea]|uniref:hypothetical protein n=1 Tax=Cyanobium sp. HWJ4-Hawea TaxID=2823713 RepID=UPI0020CCAC74|nr:hypothetical protein [Cyanobium sp. HWJ4-Hawea]MCP9809725.1 hypothetical protein [Cyanobium sp. HWJ4-Hawea]
MAKALRIALSTVLLSTTLAVMSTGRVEAKPACPDTWDSNQCDYYRDGYKAGSKDKKAGKSNEFSRHSDSYDSRFRSNYQAGYETGWDATPAGGYSSGKVKCPDTWTGAKCDYFRDGYKQGKVDRGANLSMAYQRHSGLYDSRFEEAFSVGYEAGWQGTSY